MVIIYTILAVLVVLGVAALLRSGQISQDEHQEEWRKTFEKMVEEYMKGKEDE